MSEESQFHPVVGIDLGTTYSAVAAFNKGTDQTEILKNKTEGFSGATPSVISMDALTRKAVVGQWAKRNGANDPQNTIIEIKREMGENFSAETLEKFNAQNIFKEGEPVKAYFGGEWLMPQEISAFTLMRMKQVAEEALGIPVIDAVVTVPAYFMEKHIAATREAVLLAGLYPRQLIPEPTAAAICYGVDQYDSERKRFLVYDLGGGTFDVSIIEVEEDDIGVIATSGDRRLGGGDFDDALRGWVVQELINRYQLDVRSDPRKMARIKLEAEKVKCSLSTFEEATFNLAEFNPQNPPMFEITRTQFEELILDLLNKSLSYVDIALTKASGRGVGRDDIDAILLVGGSSKMPRIRQLLLEYFQQDEDFVRSDADPDFVVARGAAILAHQYSPSPLPFNILKQPSNEIETLNPDLEEEDRVTPRLIAEHPLGIMVQGGLFNKIVDEGTGVPVSVTQGGFINGGETTEIPVQVYQGEGEYVRDCTHIGELKIGPMEPKPKGHHNFEVTFSLDRNGLLSMAVHHLNTGRMFEAQFDQKTAVGGIEAQAAMHRKLLGMYGGGLPQDAAQVTPPRAQTAAGNRVPPAQVHPGAARQAPPVPVQPDPGQQVPPSPVPPGPGAETQATPAQPETPADNPYDGIFPTATENAVPPEPQPVKTGQPVVTPAHDSPGGATGMPPAEAPQISEPAAPGKAAPTALAAFEVEVPAEYKQLVRRSQRQIGKQYNENLAIQFNRFATALNSGVTGDDLEDIGDDLADAFDDARHISA